MSRGIYLIFTVLIASSCCISVATAINHGTGGGGTLPEENPSGLELFKLRTALTTPWGEPCGEFGTCYRKHDCTADGGFLDGRCGLLGYCCTSGASHLTPSTATYLKRSLITRPRDLSSPVSYFIQARTNLVCQLRIEFEKFVLAEPSLQDNHPQCQADSFQVDDIKLCGMNTGQHIYVPFNASSGMTSKELRFTLASRTINPTLVDPDWKIRVTQLECPNSVKRVALKRQNRNMISTGTDAEVEDQEENVEDREARVARVSDEIPASDAYWVAPAGCLQYFPEAAGTVESFNFNNGNGVYMGNMKYSICFRRTSKNQQLVITANTFALGSSEPTATNEGYDELCYTNIMSPGRSEDYLFIPEAIRQAFPNVRATRFCGTSIQGVTVISNMPGPFAIHFNSDMYYDTTRVESGFRLTYQIS